MKNPSLAKLMADKILNSKLVLLNECGHFIWRDQKEKYFAILKDFLTSYLNNDNEFSIQKLYTKEQYTCKL